MTTADWTTATTHFVITVHHIIVILIHLILLVHLFWLVRGLIVTSVRVVHAAIVILELVS
jgi:hypothetical protein